MKPHAIVAAMLVVVAAMLAGCGSRDPVELFQRGDYDAAFEAFSERAASGDPVALNYLGTHYYLGAGVERDHERAFELYEQAAHANIPAAQLNLAIMYMNGYGVPLSNQSAYGWFFQALSGGNDAARDYLVSLADNVTPNAGRQAREQVATVMREKGFAEAAQKMLGMKDANAFLGTGE